MDRSGGISHRPAKLGSNNDRLESRKEIAEYPRRDIRTVRRREEIKGLFVHFCPSRMTVTADLEWLEYLFPGDSSRAV